MSDADTFSINMPSIIINEAKKLNSQDSASNFISYRKFIEQSSSNTHTHTHTHKMKIFSPVPNCAWYFSVSLPWPILMHVHSMVKTSQENQKMSYLLVEFPLNGIGFG